MKDLLTSKEKSYYNWRFGDIYYARKGVELCDGINADNNAQLNGMIRDSKRMFQEYINQNAQKVPEKAKKERIFFKIVFKVACKKENPNKKKIPRHDVIK